MQIRRDSTGYLIRVQKGERVRETLTAFARDHGVTGARVQAIGAFDEAELAYFDESEQAYRNRTFGGGLEVLALLGNISRLPDGEPMVHLHAMLGTSDYSVVGGHLNEGLVSVTIEAFVTPTDEPIDREEPFGPFKLWNLEKPGR